VSVRCTCASGGDGVVSVVRLTHDGAAELGGVGGTARLLLAGAAPAGFAQDVSAARAASKGTRLGAVGAACSSAAAFTSPWLTGALPKTGEAAAEALAAEAAAGAAPKAPPPEGNSTGTSASTSTAASTWASALSASTAAAITSGFSTGGCVRGGLLSVGAERAQSCTEPVHLGLKTLCGFEGLLIASMRGL
jgi:hypothetical protein